MTFIERSVEGKKIVWSGNSNRFLLLEEHAYEVMTRLIAGVQHDLIVRWCADSYGLPVEEGNRFVGEVRSMLEHFTVSESGEPLGSNRIGEIRAGQFAETKCYQISNLHIRVDYENDRLKTLIHPKFAHLESSNQRSVRHLFQFVEQDDEWILLYNGEIKGRWNPGQEGLLIGRFFVELLNLIYRKTNEDWMAVFHASSLSDGRKAILFAGESGSGKTTLSALLVSHGFRLLSDDLAPVDARSQHAFSFPAALSVKSKALELLSPIFPGLQSADEFYYPELNKKVRYLAPDQEYGFKKEDLPCRAIVFVKFQEHSGLNLESMPADVAFRHLVPDSWISPLAQNVEKFLDWFLAMPCYKLTYSDIDKMVHVVKELFENEPS